MRASCAKKQPGATNLLALNRLANTVARLSAADAALLTALGPRPGEEQPAPNNEPSPDAKREAESLIAQWQRELRQISGDDEDDEL